MEVKLSNITNIEQVIKKEHPFEFCLELDEEVTNGLQMADAYTCVVKLWETNKVNLKTFPVSISSNVITVSSDTATGLDFGDYFIKIQPSTPSLSNYVTIQGELKVE